jgi:hypothetical protein
MQQEINSVVMAEITRELGRNSYIPSHFKEIMTLAAMEASRSFKFSEDEVFLEDVSPMVFVAWEAFRSGRLDDPKALYDEILGSSDETQAMDFLRRIFDVLARFMN